MTRAQAVLLRAFSIWTIYVWVTRIWNIVNNSDNSAGFKAVHSLIALISVAFAVAALVVVSRIRRKGQDSGSADR